VCSVIELFMNTNNLTPNRNSCGETERGTSAPDHHGGESCSRNRHNTQRGVSGVTSQQHANRRRLPAPRIMPRGHQAGHRAGPKYRNQPRGGWYVGHPTARGPSGREINPVGRPDPTSDPSRSAHLLASRHSNCSQVKYFLQVSCQHF
jgi:hypothetical protein